MRSLFYLFILLIFYSCGSKDYNFREPKFEYVKDNFKFTEDSEINAGTWSEKLLIKESGASRLSPDEIKRMQEEENERLLYEVMKQRYFFQFKNKLAGKVSLYQVGKDGETPRNIAFKVYGDGEQAYDILKVNPDIDKIDQPLKKGKLVFYVIPVITKLLKKGIAYNVVKGDWITKISQNLFEDMTKWKDLWKRNSLFIKNPHLIHIGDLLFWYPDWLDKKDVTLRNRIKKQELNSYDVETMLIKEALETTPPNVMDDSDVEFDEFR